MHTLGEQDLWSFPDDDRTAKVVSNGDVREGPGHQVGSFLELATRVAELQFRNRDHVLLFRGQGGDFLNRAKRTSLKPTLLRAMGRRNPDAALLEQRFDLLKAAERELVARYKAGRLLGVDRLKRHRILRWAILQHYEVCPTPLLDLTHSLRIAASFASLNPKAAEGFVFVLGVPNLSGAITASAEAGLQIVRLSSVCPPTAMRPHIQEGYLLGEYPDLDCYDQKGLYQAFEVDFGRRLVAKFRFDPWALWEKKDVFPPVPEAALYPSADEDPLYRLTLEVKGAIRGA